MDFYVGVLKPPKPIWESPSSVDRNSCRNLAAFKRPLFVKKKDKLIKNLCSAEGSNLFIAASSSINCNMEQE